MENELVNELLKELKERVSEIKGLNLRRPKELLTSVVIVVKFVESLARSERIQKVDKKSLALELINSLVDIPYLPEFLEQSIFSWLIDMSVETANRLLGKLWIEKVGG